MISIVDCVYNSFIALRNGRSYVSHNDVYAILSLYELACRTPSSYYPSTIPMPPPPPEENILNADVILDPIVDVDVTSTTSVSVSASCGIDKYIEESTDEKRVKSLLRGLDEVLAVSTNETLEEKCCAWITGKYDDGLRTRQQRARHLKKYLESETFNSSPDGKKFSSDLIKELAKKIGIEFLYEFKQQEKAGVRPGKKTLDEESAAVEKVKGIYSDIQKSLDKATKFHVFGFLLPPRRNEITTLVVYDSESVVPTESPPDNYYLKDSATLSFALYKTSKFHGRQTFVINKETFPYLRDEVIARARDILAQTPNGEVFIKSANITCDMRRKVGVINHDIRMFWATEWSNHKDDDEAKTFYRAVCEFMGHTPTTSRLNYVVPLVDTSQG